MGKKKVVKPSKESLLKERDKIEEKLTKGEAVKVKKRITNGRVYIKSSYNNTVITLTDEKGDVLFWTSAGRISFRGTKKGTPFAAAKVAESASVVINKMKIESVEIFVKGIGQGREAALRGLAHRGINIVRIKDVTPIPHNGCRPRKARRV